MSQARVGNPHPSRESFEGRINNVESVEQMRAMLAELIHAVTFRADHQDSTGNTTIQLAQNTPVAPGMSTCRVVLGPHNPNSVSANPTPKPVALVQGTVNQDIPQPNPVTGPDTSVPTMQLAIRGFNNHALRSADGYLSDATYSGVIPSHEAHLTVVVGGKTLYGRIPLSEHPDTAVPRPLLGWTGFLAVPDTGTTLPNPTPITVADVQANVAALLNKLIWNTKALGYQTDALKQAHNDMAQSNMAMGLYRLVSREGEVDVLAADATGPS